MNQSWCHYIFTLTDRKSVLSLPVTEICGPQTTNRAIDTNNGGGSGTGLGPAPVELLTSYLYCCLSRFISRFGRTRPVITQQHCAACEAFTLKSRGIKQPLVSSLLTHLLTGGCEDKEENMCRDVRARLLPEIAR